MAYNILTHDRIQMPPSTGVLAATGLSGLGTANGINTSASGNAWGGNALQSITIGRHTPHEPVQAIGFLGIVDYHTGIITSDIALDCILVEGSDLADTSGLTNDAYKYAAKQIVIGTESYVLTSCSVAFQAGNPATVNYGLLTGTLASYLATQAAPAPLTAGEEAEFAVVMGDDGSGIYLLPTWYGTPPPAGVIPIINSSGALATTSDNGIPAGVQSLQYSATINRDRILDVRTTSAVQFITTYPVDVSMDVEVYCPPNPSGQAGPGDVGYTGARSTYTPLMNKLQNLGVNTLALGKHVSGVASTIAPVTAAACYVQATGLTLDDESEAVQVGRYLMHTYRFRATDMVLPLPGTP